MIEILQELQSATTLLQSALQRYFDACAALRRYQRDNSPLVGDARRTLSDHVTNELTLVTSLSTQLSAAESVVRQTRNSFTPVNALPTEILARVFHFLVDSSCANTDPKGQKIRLPRYPDFLSHVCSYWRSVALNTPGLWTHIDLVRKHSLSTGFEDRARCVTARSGPLPVNLHVYEQLVPDEDFGDYSYDIISPLVARVRSLELMLSPEIRSSDEIQRPCAWLLEELFADYEQGIFEELTIKFAGTLAPIFICIDYPPRAYSYDEDPYGLGIPPEKLEPILLGVKFLTLEGVFFPWSHPLYHALVELRLTVSVAASEFSPATITESDLTGILISSPGLRVFYFGLKITDPLPRSQGTMPVHLPLLEILDLTSMACDEIGMLTRLLAPISQPLKFAVRIKTQRCTLPVYSQELLRFFARSNVTGLLLREVRSISAGEWTLRHRWNIDDLIHPLPRLRLQALALDGFQYLPDPNPVLDVVSETMVCEHSRAAPGGACLDALYLIRCGTFLDTIRHIVKRHPVRVLTISDSAIQDGLPSEWDDDVWTIHNSDLKSRLSGVCPNLRVEYWYDRAVQSWLEE